MLFKKKSKTVQESRSQEIMANKIADGLIKFQIKVSNQMNQKTAHFSRTQKQMLLIGISLFFSACSLYLIFQSIQ